MHMPFVRIALVAALAAGLSTSTRAQEKTLPKAEEVMDNYVKVTGGEEAYKKLKNRVTTGTVDFEGTGLTGKITLTEAAPNNAIAEFDLGANGTITRGTNGTDAWEISTLTGERVMEGAERDEFFRESDFLGEVNWREQYEKVETIGEEEVDGMAAYKLILTPKTGAPATAYFGKESGLLVKELRTVSTPQGEVPVEVTATDYKEVDGIKLPHTMIQKLSTLTMKISFDDIKHDVDLPADKFEAPEAIKKLLKK
jgi:hypothetical protein